MSRELIVNSMTLKVEKANAKAMIEGFYKNSIHHHVSIFVANGEHSWSLRGCFRLNPKLITPMKQQRGYYYLSEIGKSLNPKSYSFQIKRIAVLDRIYHIQDDSAVWDILCNNGIFDIWQPSAPAKRLQLGQENKPMILLLRLFEIDYDFTDKIIDDQYFHSVPQRLVNIKNPIIANENFVEIIELINSSISHYILNIEQVCDSSSI